MLGADVWPLPLSGSSPFSPPGQTVLSVFFSQPGESRVRSAVGARATLQVEGSLPGPRLSSHSTGSFPGTGFHKSQGWGKDRAFCVSPPAAAAIPPLAQLLADFPLRYADSHYFFTIKSLLHFRPGFSAGGEAGRLRALRASYSCIDSSSVSYVTSPAEEQLSAAVEASGHILPLSGILFHKSLLLGNPVLRWFLLPPLHRMLCFSPPAVRPVGLLPSTPLAKPIPGKLTVGICDVSQPTRTSL